MLGRTLRLAFLTAALMPALSVPGQVVVTAGPEQERGEAGGRRTVQSVTLSNELCHYTLTYDIVRLPDRTDQIASHWWIWTLDYVTLGMTEPSTANWYFQGFFNWHFDGEALHNRPAAMRVIRAGGADGVVEYVWDAPTVRAVVRFALASRSDKLLMWGLYEPREPVRESRLKLTCYPTGFDAPRQRAVTTAAGTFPAGATVSLDLARERWVLYEDTTPGRPGCGPAGLLIGTPDSFSSVTIPVGNYGIDTRLDLKPDRRSFALALYDYPAFPGLEETRALFRAQGDAEARWLEAAAADGFAKGIPPGMVSAERLEAIRAAAEKALARGIERWQPDPEPLRFAWALPLAGGPVRTVLFAPRFAAFETMELARRVDLRVRHLYWDAPDALSSQEYWPYAAQTGQGPIGTGAAGTVAMELCERPDTELFLCAGVSARSFPPAVLQRLLGRVSAGAGLFVSGAPALVDSWPAELFAEVDPERTEAVLQAIAWESIPGHAQGDPGRASPRPLALYRYGKGLVAALRAAFPPYGVLVPRNAAVEGLEGAADRSLALCARALLAVARPAPSPCRFRGVDAGAGGRTAAVLLEPGPPPGATLLCRVADDLDQELYLEAVPARSGEVSVPLPVLPGGRRCWLDLVLRDAEGRSLDVRSVLLPERGDFAIGEIALEPALMHHEKATPLVDLPGAGPLGVRVALRAASALDGAFLRCEVRDAFDRLLARGQVSLSGTPGETRLALALPAPVTVCHRLDVRLVRGDDLLAAARQRFTRPLAYPYDDFTVLMWSYAGGEPVIRRTNRACYELGAEMMDLCHMGGYGDADARREYELAARSGLRLVPYVTRIAGDADERHVRSPCLHDPAYLERTRSQLAVQARQAAPYCPAAFTLGDENYLLGGSREGCHAAASVEAFRQWLAERYGTIARLNEVWGTACAGFADIGTPMLLEEAAAQTVSFAPWLDHKRFMDHAFAATHEAFAEVLQARAPEARVGWDGLLGYHWRAGYDFARLCRNLRLNQTYTTNWLQGELVRCLKGPGALTGKWGNAAADNEAGFAAWPWDCLLAGDNSVWWWTSWGCDYIPFHPDLSLSQFGRWFFPAAREAAAGPGRLLLHAERRHSGIGVLYSQADLFAGVLTARLGGAGEDAGDGAVLTSYEALAHGIHDLGFEYRFLAADALEAAGVPEGEFRVLCLSLAACLSDRQAAALRAFVEAGGTLLVDGRAGLLTGEGRLRERAALDELLGVAAPAGLPALRERASETALDVDASLPGVARTVPLRVRQARLRILSPGLRTAGGQALATAGGGEPVLVANRVGRGLCLTLNTSWRRLADERLAEGERPLAQILAAALESAGIEPPARLRGADGARVRAVRLSRFTDGPLEYLGVQQDILLRGLPDQEAVLSLDREVHAFDVRAGEPLAAGPVREWPVKITRGRPLLFALLPYRVTGLEAEAPPAAAAGETVSVGVRVRVTPGRPGFHVVRLDVFAPGSDTPHRQYSRNVSCPEGAGTVAIPFALDDPAGQWRCELRDVASGLRSRLVLSVAPPL